MKNNKWYVLRVITGKERTIKEQIDKLIERNKNLSININRILLPVEKIYKIKNGKKIINSKNFFPGYILIETEMSGEVQHSIEKITNVMHFLKDNKIPTPMRKHEIDRILRRVDDNIESKINIPYLIDENVSIIDGPFGSFNGLITNIDNNRRKIKLNVKIFGRETPIELNYEQVEKI